MGWGSSASAWDTTAGNDTNYGSITFGGTGTDYGYGVAVDGSGNVYTTGYFEGTVDFGAGDVTSAGGRDGFVTKYNAAGVHQWTTTFGGTALACAVANAVLDVVLADGFMDEVKRKGSFLMQSLAAVVDTHPGIFEGVRGEGLMIGVKCRAPAGEVTLAARDEGLLVIPAGDNVVRFLPGLVATEEDLREATRRLDSAASAMEKAGKAVETA